MRYRNLKYFIAALMFFSFLSKFFAQPASSVKHPEWSYDKTIYEINLRQFTPSGTIKEFREHLPRLKELGVGILWFMPIHPIGVENRKGTLGSYYSVKDYKDVDPLHGTLEEFGELVKEIHDAGMYVILDWVANHSAWDNEWMKTNPDFYSRDEKGNVVPPIQDWHDVADLNYDNRELWNAMLDAMIFWVKEYDIDGYRCDVAGMVPTEFWNFVRPELEKIKPVFMLAEWESVEMHLNAFDMTYGWDLHNMFNAIAKKEKNAEDIIKFVREDKKRYPENAFRMNFTSNHDENSWKGTEFERLGDGAKTFAALTYFLPGMPLIYSGQEAGFNKRLSFFEKDDIVWEENEFKNFYSSLNQLHKSESLLWNGERESEFIPIDNSKQKEVLTFLRKNDQKKIFVLANLSEGEVEFSLKDKKQRGSYYNFLNGVKMDLGSNDTFKFKPWEYQIWIEQK